MVQSLKATLTSLRDVDGIVGSFVVNAEGELIAQDLPAYFAGVAEEVGPRVLRLRDALALSEGNVSACTVRYSNHKLTLRSVPGAVLAVLAVATVNAPALRMAMNLVARKCAAGEGTSGELASSSAPPIVHHASAPPPRVAPAVSAPPPPAFATQTLTSIPDGVRTNLDPAAPAVGASKEAASRERPANEAPPKSKHPVFFRGKRVG